ncbi:hypothetical protein HN51_005551 [Arachis hypogaea]|uniref:RING-type E3 ubiquitin transferase n=1 Tax=Arachis hypogaea TaxID=3818 RepID=A0A445DE47_ARAHY|nr:uncharacterized protein LOC112797267 [Arachis hypogaea]XP_025695899.1 uncharacterized protein LOC112797267 [Arachis hypogaea]QHO39329.1 E3 ubiquitin-protein ligase RING1-like [Arachis hypogaea]QHO39330.1 E3 ubiquitin-protein ligase RING1-like [Arachis hypogaea]RYR61450.1 hypothetical protein Ahy_A04g018634 [Arachis hypogaea]
MSANSENVGVCSLCQKALSPDNEMTSDPATVGVCGDCKFLLLEDYGNHMVTPQSMQRRFRGRFRRNSSESVDNMVNNLRQSRSATASLEDVQQIVEGDAAAWSTQHASLHNTPSGSRRWRRVLSDTDSDGFDNWSSLYGENESNESFRRYRIPHGETDSLSFSVYGGDSDVSVDRHSIIHRGMFGLPDVGDEFDSDTDIDPMHAGVSHWHSDDMEDDEEEEEDNEDDDDEEEEEEDVEREWEIADAVEAEATARLQMFFTSNSSASRGSNVRVQRFDSAESEVVQMVSNWGADLEDTGLHPYGANFGDYLDARQFEDFLEHLAENDNSRRGAPPASLSFVNNLPRVVVDKDHEKHGELVCAICKDALVLGTEASQLPCSHLYHGSCILPWLSTRNSCPLCRYELPTDDKDYEEGKQNGVLQHVNHDRQQLEMVDVDDSSSDVSVLAEVNEADSISQSVIHHTEVVSSNSSTNSSAVRGGRGRWFFLAAAPIVSLVGIVLVLWLGNSQIEGNRHLSGRNMSAQDHHTVNVYATPVQRESRSRRWWCPF